MSFSIPSISPPTIAASALITSAGINNISSAIAGGTSPSLTGVNGVISAINAATSAATVSTLIKRGATNADVAVGQLNALPPSSGVAAVIARAFSGTVQFLWIGQTSGAVNTSTIDSAGAAAFGNLTATGTLNVTGVTTHAGLVTVNSAIVAQNAILTAPNTSTAPLVLKGSDNATASRALAVQWNNGTENAFINQDGSASFAVNLAATGAFQVTAAASFNNLLAFAGIAAPAPAPTNQARIYVTTSGVIMYSQSGSAYAPLASSAAASGAAGAVQIAAAGNAFSNDAANFFWDATNHRLGLGTNAPATQLDMTAALTLRGMTLPTPTLTGQAIFAYDAATNQAKLSNNGLAFSALVQQSIAGTQTIQSTTGQVILQSATGTVVHGQLTQDTSGSISSQGGQAGLSAFDRTPGPNYFTWHRDATNIYLFGSEAGIDIWTINGTNGAFGIGSKFNVNADGSISSTAAMAVVGTSNGVTLGSTYTPSTTNTNIIGLSAGGALALNGAASGTNIRGIAVPAWTRTDSTAVTAAQFIGLYMQPQTALTGLTLTDAWSIFASVPTAGTNNAAAYFQATSANPFSVGIGVLANSRPLATLNVGQAATGTIGALFNGISGGTVDILRIDPTIGLTVNANGIIARWDQFGRYYEVQAAQPTVTSVSVGTGGTPSFTVTAGNDRKGVITITTGNTAVPNGSALLGTVNLKNALNATPKDVTIIPTQGNAVALTVAQQICRGTMAAGTFNVVSGATALAANTTYTWVYEVFI